MKITQLGADMKRHGYIMREFKAAQKENPAEIIITREDIRGSVNCSTDRCPGARAATRALGGAVEHVFLTASRAYVAFKRGPKLVYRHNGLIPDRADNGASTLGLRLALLCPSKRTGKKQSHTPNKATPRARPTHISEATLARSRATTDHV